MKVIGHSLINFSFFPQIWCNSMFSNKFEVCSCFIHGNSQVFITHLYFYNSLGDARFVLSKTDILIEPVAVITVEPAVQWFSRESEACISFGSSV